MSEPFPGLEHVREYIDNHIERVSAVEEVARHMRCDAETLCRMWRKNESGYLWTYLKERRVGKALDEIRALLLRTDPAAALYGTIDEVKEMMQEYLPAPESNWPDDVKAVVMYGSQVVSCARFGSKLLMHIGQVCTA